jgi:hypothetical protein
MHLHQNTDKRLSKSLFHTSKTNKNVAASEKKEKLGSTLQSARLNIFGRAAGKR